MVTPRTRITVHVVAVDIYKDRMGVFFSKYGEVEGVKALISKSGIASGHMVYKSRKVFGEIPNILMCR